MPVSKRARQLVATRRGILLDVSLGGTKQPNSVSFQELRWSPLRLPWPLPPATVHTAVVTHVLDFVPPDAFFRWCDELHRVMRPGGVAYLSGPYGGDESAGWVSDPTHRTRIVEATFAWLDPATPLYGLHETVGRTQPRPWRVVTQARVPGTLGTVSYNVTLQALAAEKGDTRPARRSRVLRQPDASTRASRRKVGTR